MEKWYEVAVSYVDDCGTETIATFDKLKDAKQYITEENILSWDSVEFAFIDKWEAESGGSAWEDETFTPIIYKENK